MYDDFLYKQVQKTLILPENIKQEVLSHFDKLSKKQIYLIRQLIQSENAILLNFLKKQKDEWIIGPWELKNEYLQYRKQKRNILESKERKEEQQELEYLLKEIS